LEDGKSGWLYGGHCGHCVPAVGYFIDCLYLQFQESATTRLSEYMVAPVMPCAVPRALPWKKPPLTVRRITTFNALRTVARPGDLWHSGCSGLATWEFSSPISLA